MNFTDFIQSDWHNFWIEEPGLKLYVRKTPPTFKHKWGDIQLASLAATQPGNGSLRAFLSTYEPHHQFYIENIFSDRLVRFFENRGYVIQNSTWYPYPLHPACMLAQEKRDSK